MYGKKASFNQDAMPLLALVAMVVWFSQEIIWGGKVPFYRDLPVYFYPIRFSLARSFNAGELPLWDRHMGMGFPLLADFQSGTFYLPHLFYLIFPFFTAVNVSFVFHYVTAATGSYLLCRWWRYPPYLALVGATLFTFGGAMISLTNVLNHFQTAVWLPWLVFSWERALITRSAKNFLFFVLISLLQFLAGSPEIYLMSVGLACVAGLRIRALAGLSHLKIFSFLLAANALVAGLGMVQILPTVELLLESRGKLSIPFVESSLWSLHPLKLINFFVLDKEVDAAVHNGLHLFFLRDVPFLITYYMGVISFLGVCLWFFHSSVKENGLLLGLLMVSLLFALGSYTPLYRLAFQYVPLFSLFRFPEKFFFFVYGLILFMALRGLSGFLQPDRPASRGATFILSFAFGLLLFAYLYVRYDTLPLSRFITWATGTPLSSTPTLHKTSAAIVALERQIGLVLGLLLLFYLSKRGALRKSLFEPLLCLLVFIDLNSAHQPYQYALDPGPVHNGPRILQGGEDRARNRLFYYPGESDLHPSYYAIANKPSFSGLSAGVFSNLVPNSGVFFGIDYMQEIDALRRWPYLIFLGGTGNMPKEQLYRLLAALNVRYIVSFGTLDGKDISLVRSFPEFPSWLYELKEVTPRVYIVAKAAYERDPTKVVDRLSKKEFDPLKEVLLDRLFTLPGKNGFQSRAEIVHYANQTVSIRASLNDSGVLVLADSFYPGWRVYVDGNEGEIFRANLFFRGVPLSAGEHVVEFRYEPRSFKIGLLVSSLVLTIVLSLSVWLVRK